MEANKGEAERCLHEAVKWQRANRPVKALKFAKKSHSLYPTAAAQQKVGELTDEVQQRQANYRHPTSSLLNDAPNPHPNSAPNPNRASQSSSNEPHHSPPENQEFVEIDPNEINRPQSTLWTNIQSLEWWSLLLESVFGPCFESMHYVMAPFVPQCLSAFRLRYRSKVWALLLAAILLIFTRFVIVQHPFGAQSHAEPSRYRRGYNDHEDIESGYNAPKSEYERTKENFEAKYGSNAGASRHSSGSERRRKSEYERKKENFEAKYESKYESNRHRQRQNNRHRDRYDSYYDHYGGRGSGGGYYSNGGGGMNWWYLLVFGLMIAGMVQGNNGGNGMNWNMMAMLPMMMGGPGFGFGFGRRGMFGRRRMFGRRGRFF